MNIQPVNNFYFLYQLAWNRDIHKTIKTISDLFKTKSFKVKFPLLGKTLYVLQEAHQVKPVLKAQTHLGPVNEHFNISNGHHDSINGLNMDNPLWKTLHHAMSHLFNHEKIDAIMEDHWDLLLPSDTFCINDTLKEFLGQVLSTYFFGPHFSSEDYLALQSEITEYVKLTFHSAAINRVPFVGKILCYFNYLRNKEKGEAINQKISSLIEKSFQEKTGVFFLLHEKLKAAHPEENIEKTVLDNVFLSFLVYDFVYMVALDFFVHLPDSEISRKKVLETSIDKAFLFPFRFRVAKEKIGEIQPNDVCLLNLKEANLHFSYGPRTCVGQGMFKLFMSTISKHIEDKTFTEENPEPIQYSENPDIPMILSRHTLRCKS